MYCKYCGDPIEPDEKYCDKCGKPTHLCTEPSNQEKNKKVNRKDLFSFIDIDIEKAVHYIKIALYAGLFSEAITIFVAISELPKFSYYWIDVVLMSLMLFGIYKKNTFSAISIFVYFLLSKYFQISSGGMTTFGWLFAIVFVYFYALGVVGAYKYHHLTEYKESTRKGLISGLLLGGVAIIIICYLGYSRLMPFYSESAVLYRADYAEGYRAGYTDGRASRSDIGDSYVPPTIEERKNAYADGYLSGLLTGCREGGFDCSAIEKEVENLNNEGNSI